MTSLLTLRAPSAKTIESYLRDVDHEQQKGFGFTFLDLNLLEAIEIMGVFLVYFSRPTKKEIKIVFNCTSSGVMARGMLITRIQELAYAMYDRGMGPVDVVVNVDGTFLKESRIMRSLLYSPIAWSRVKSDIGVFGLRVFDSGVQPPVGMQVARKNRRINFVMSPRLFVLLILNDPQHPLNVADGDRRILRHWYRRAILNETATQPKRKLCDSPSPSPPASDGS